MLRAATWKAIVAGESPTHTLPAVCAAPKRWRDRGAVHHLQQQVDREHAAALDRHPHRSEPG